MELLQEIVLELKTSFPTVVPDNQLNNNDEEYTICLMRATMKPN